MQEQSELRLQHEHNMKQRERTNLYNNNQEVKRIMEEKEREKREKKQIDLLRG